MAQIIHLKNTKLQAAVGDGRSLALNPDQTTKLTEDTKMKIIEFQNRIQKNTVPSNAEKIPDVVESSPVSDVSPVQTVMGDIPVSNVVPEAVVEPAAVNIPVENETAEPSFVAPEMPVQPDLPVVEPVVSSENIPEVPVTDMPNIAINSIPAINTPVVEEIANVIPSVVDISMSTSPVIEASPVNQVEIVSEKSQNTVYDNLLNEISSINEEYDQKIKDINVERTLKIREIFEKNKQGLMDMETQIIDFKNRAEEHLKNAQAAEQIATIAHQNAQNIQTDVAKIA